MRRKKNELTKQENIFFKEYIKTSDMLRALNTAYPTSVKWSKNSQYAQASKILNKPIMNTRIKEHNDAEKKALANSTLLNKRKILNEIIRQYTETAENGASERTNSINLLKLMAQISKLLDNSPQINNNIVVNNQNINDISNFLDL